MEAPIALLVFTDGRERLLARSMTSLNQVIGSSAFTEQMIVDDSGNPRYSEWLKATYPDALVYSRPKRLGFCKTVEDGWAFLNMVSECEYVFHIEDDFVYEEWVDLQKMAKVLEKHDTLAQLALLRQSVSPEEKRVGGIYKKHGLNCFEEKHDPEIDAHWVEHSVFWTTNPSLFHIDILQHGWPTEPQCEGLFGIKMRQMGYKFGFWGKLEDPPKISHIGDTRVGTGY